MTEEKQENGKKKDSNYYREPKYVEVLLHNGQSSIVPTAFMPRVNKKYGVNFLEFLDEYGTIHQIALEAITIIREYRKELWDEKMKEAQAEQDKLSKFGKVIRKDYDNELNY